MKQNPLAIGVDTEPDFEHFVAGDNAAALHALGRLKLPSPPVYLHGPAGSMPMIRCPGPLTKAGNWW